MIPSNDDPLAEVQQRLAAMYDSGDLPWDDALPPPEVIETVQALATKELPGRRALDLGCGYGRTAIYLAQAGWTVDAIDFVPQAVEEARRRSEQAGVAEAIHLHVADVTRLDFLIGPYDLAIDVGCSHAFNADVLKRYATGLGRLIRPGALFLLFARLRTASPEPSGPRGLDETVLREQFDRFFALERVAYGETESSEDGSWPSAWFWYRRRA